MASLKWTKSVLPIIFFLFLFTGLIFQIISEEFTLLKGSSTESNKSDSPGNLVTDGDDSKDIDFEELRTNVIDVLAEQKAELEQW